MPIIETRLNYEMEEKQKIALLETVTKVVSYEMNYPFQEWYVF